MKLDLREIIDIPGASLPFDCALDDGNLSFPSVANYHRPPVARGIIKNSAGAMSLIGELSAGITAVCDRCGDFFELEKTLPLDAPLATGLIDEDNADIFALEGDTLNLSCVLETCFILAMDAKFLCREDCAGLCERCGSNLNHGKCSCGAKLDPRLAVLEQLLDID